MLDLSKIGKNKYYEVRLIDGTELKLNRPTQRMLQFMLNIQDMAKDNKDMETIKAFNELFAWILNRNTEGKVYKAEQIADEYDFAIIGLLIKDYFSFWNEDTANIIIDEIQFLTGDIKVLLYLSIIKDIDIYCAGLNMTSEQEPFGIMPYVLAVSDKVVNTVASCNICGRDAYYTYFVGNKDQDVVVGDENYLSLCSKHLRERRQKDNVLKLVKKIQSYHFLIVFSLHQ